LLELEFEQRSRRDDNGLAFLYARSHRPNCRALTRITRDRADRSPRGSTSRRFAQ
jgi:hypothetical protein